MMREGLAAEGVDSWEEWQEKIMEEGRRRQAALNKGNTPEGFESLDTRNPKYGPGESSIDGSPISIAKFDLFPEPGEKHQVSKVVNLEEIVRDLDSGKMDEAGLLDTLGPEGLAELQTVMEKLYGEDLDHNNPPSIKAMEIIKREATNNASKDKD